MADRAVQMAAPFALAAVLAAGALAAGACTHRVREPTVEPTRASAGAGAPAGGRAPEAGVRIHEKRILYLENIEFEADGSEIRKESHRVLLEIGRAIREHPELGRILIEGRGRDDEPDPAARSRLGAARASAVRAFLIEHGGVPAKRLLAGAAAGASRDRIDFILADARR